MNGDGLKSLGLVEANINRGIGHDRIKRGSF